MEEEKANASWGMDGALEVILASPGVSLVYRYRTAKGLDKNPCVNR